MRDACLSFHTSLPPPPPPTPGPRPRAIGPTPTSRFWVQIKDLLPGVYGREGGIRHVFQGYARQGERDAKYTKSVSRWNAQDGANK